MAHNKHERIIEAAIKVFAKKGFYNATVADVAEIADVGEGTIYLYFKNKDDLLISIFEHSIDIFIKTVNEEIKGAKSPEDKLKRFIALHLSLVEQNKELAQVLQIELRQSSKFMKEYRGRKFADYLALVQSILEEGQQKGIFRNDLEPHILRRALFGAVDEMALDWLLQRKKKYSLDAFFRSCGEPVVPGLLKM